MSNNGNGHAAAPLARVLHLSDLHFGSEDRQAIEQVEIFAKHTKPDALLVSGDITQRGARVEFQAAADWFDKVGGHAVLTPGNHDTPLYNLPARMISPFERYCRYMGKYDAVGKLVELADGAVRVTAINTARGFQARRNWAEGVIDLDDFDDALKRLTGGKPDAWRVLLCHHPLAPPPGARIPVTTLRGRQALERAAQAGIDVVLTGHVHDAFASSAGNTSMSQLGSGTLSTRRRGSPPSFCVLDFSADALVQQVVHVEAGALSIVASHTITRRGANLGTQTVADR